MLLVCWLDVAGIAGAYLGEFHLVQLMLLSTSPVHLGSFESH